MASHYPFGIFKPFYVRRDMDVNENEKLWDTIVISKYQY